MVAGLITVLFMPTIALTKDGDEVRESKIATVVFPLFFLALRRHRRPGHEGPAGPRPALPAGAEAGGFGDVLWKQRTFDLIGQIAVIFAGVFAVLALFRKRDKHE